MDQDSLIYDSLDIRPLPKWLTDQRDGLNTVQPARMEMKDDRSLAVSFILTGAIILLAVTVLTVYFLRKKKKKQ
jgi:heme/copper-type cytochrome/quinol oxidase subunit 2